MLCILRDAGAVLAVTWFARWQRLRSERRYGFYPWIATTCPPPLPVQKATYRSIQIDDERTSSNSFADLHTHSYEEILDRTRLYGRRRPSQQSRLYPNSERRLSNQIAANGTRLRRGT